MKCPCCEGKRTGVIDVRAVGADGKGTLPIGVAGVRRRRKCDQCGYRWTTFELAAEDVGRSVVSKTKRSRARANANLRKKIHNLRLAHADELAA